MKVAPIRALTHAPSSQMRLLCSVEMKVAPIRALTQQGITPRQTKRQSRNEGRPYQGIDTF